MSRILRVVVCALVVLCAKETSHAVTLDWDVATWTPGSLSGAVDIDNTMAGAEVTFSITGNTNKLRVDPASGLQTPAITSSLQGGTTQQSLTFTANVGTQTEITVSVSFSALYTQGVESVSFTIFDIDKTTDSEFIKNIWGIGLDGTLVPATISNLGSSVQLTGTGLTQLLTGTASSPDAGPVRRTATRRSASAQT